MRSRTHLHRPIGCFFAVLTAFAALSAPAPSAAADDAAPSSPALSVEKLDETLYRLGGTAAGSVLVLVGKKGLLLVDSGDAEEAAAFDSVLRTISPLPVKYIVNTHYHFDHIGGNPRHRKDAKIVGHRHLWAQAEKDTVIADWGNWHRKPAPKEAKPTVLVDDSLRIDFEGDPVVAFHVPAAHTGGDLAVWFPQHNVLHTGDVVEIDAPPFIDLWAGGSVGGFINTCDRYIGLTNDATRIVPGHGRVITRTELREYRRMLGAMAGLAYESISEGRDLERFLALEPGVQFEERLGGPRGVRNTAALFFYALNGMKTAAATP